MILSLSILIGLQSIVKAQDEVIRVDTNLITVPVTVLDRDGRYVTNLQKEDFQIFEDGVEQEVALFEPTERPFTILFLLDRSGSMSDRMAELANAASVFVRQLGPDDRLMAATFADDVDELFQATRISDLKAGIRLRQRIGDRNTMVYDAVDYGLKKMKKFRGRKAIVLFSDGIGSGYFATAKSNLRDAEEQGALIYTVQFEIQPSARTSASKQRSLEMIETATTFLQGLAKKTGGRHYKLERIAGLAETFGAIADELGRHYSLGYYPKTEGKAGERRQIRVTVRQPGLAVRSRGSYIVQPSNR